MARPMAEPTTFAISTRPSLIDQLLVIGVPHRVLTVQSWVPAFARGQALTRRTGQWPPNRQRRHPDLSGPAEHASAPQVLFGRSPETARWSRPTVAGERCCPSSHPW